jgi:hypothetical protein
MIPVVGFKDYFVDGEKIVSIRKGKPKVLKGKITTGGHLQVCLYDDATDKSKYKLVHRLIAQAYLPDYSEDLQVDHIDRCRTNNNISNLRMATHAENQHNRDAKGYYFYKRLNKWMAQIAINNKQKYLGYFDTESEARQAYLDAKKIHHPTAPINATEV